MQPRLPSALLFFLAGLALAAPAHADRLVTSDGRIIEVKKARKLPDGSYKLVFESGEVLCPARFVASVEIEGDMADYVPASEDEKKKLEQGFVRYRGKWLTKVAYQAELNKQAEASKARVAELAAHADFHDAWQKETKHFVVRSNTSPEILDYYCELLECYYELMDQRVGIDPSPMLKKTKMKVSVYKSRPEFTEITQMPPGVAGFFNSHDGELHFYHDYEDPSVSQWVALHEGTHLLTFLIEPQARPWIWVNEGVADYFGAAEVSVNKKGKLQIDSGKISLERLLTVQQAMKDGTYVPLEKLFKLSRDGFQAFQYAHSWSFVYFLNNSKPEYEKGFKKFFKDFYTVAKGIPYSEEASANQYGSAKVIQPAEIRRLLLEKLGVKDVGRLEDEWKAFITSIPIDAPRARYKRGIDALYYGDDEEEKAGLEDLEAAIQGGVEEARAYWGRGMMRMLVTGDVTKAVEDLRKAVELDPLKPGYHTNLAQLLVGMDLMTPGISVDMRQDKSKKYSEEALVDAELHFGLACDIDPDNEFFRRSRDQFAKWLQKQPAPK